MYREIDPSSFATAVDNGAFVLDVREPSEFESGHVASSQLIPLGDLPQRLGELPTDRTLHVICRTGNRSAHAVQLLDRVGLDAVNVAGGTVAWAQAGRPLVTGREGAVA
jgi:rhodanese-related sulfurtransferase